MHTPVKPILFIDSDCVMCSGLARFLLKNSNIIQIAPLNGETAEKLLSPPPDIDSIVYHDGSAIHLRSKACLEAAKKLRYPWKLLIILNIFPAFLREPVYDFIARRRKRLFSKSESKPALSNKTEYCSILKPEERVRILN